MTPLPPILRRAAILAGAIVSAVLMALLMPAGAESDWETSHTGSVGPPGDIGWCTASP
ncbi:MAG: hypothetical protein H7338_11535 [Candidatus Sericytochromatia bacterium]|nr:hypothetical protein [Candidatus Sericytochromatia bacterium]